MCSRPHISLLHSHFLCPTLSTLFVSHLPLCSPHLPETAHHRRAVHWLACQRVAGENEFKQYGQLCNIGNLAQLAVCVCRVCVQDEELEMRETREQ